VPELTELEAVTIANDVIVYHWDNGKVWVFCGELK
jgi:hypothetical protein